MWSGGIALPYNLGQGPRPRTSGSSEFSLDADKEIENCSTYIKFTIKCKQILLREFIVPGKYW